MGSRPTGAPFAGAGKLLEPGMRQRLLLSWRLLRDPRVAPRLKLVAPAVALLYLVSPVDLVPDLLVGLGQLDDLGVVAVAILLLTRLLPRLAPPEVVREHLAGMGIQVNDPGGSADRRVVDARYTVRN